MVGLLPSTAVTLPLPNLRWKTRSRLGYREQAVDGRVNRAVTPVFDGLGPAMTGRGRAIAQTPAM